MGLGPDGFDPDMTLIDSRRAIVAAFAAFAAVSRDTGTRIGLRQVDRRLGIKLEDELGFQFSREGMPGPGNQFTANSGAGLRDLMARMGHDSTRAAMIYQHEAGGADKAITEAIDRHVEGQQRGDDDGDDGAAGVLVPAG